MVKLLPRSLATTVVVLWLIGVISEATDEDLFNIQCDTMAPINYDPNPLHLKDHPCPYILEVKTYSVVPGDLVNMTLKSIYKYMPFKAFMIQVRDDNDTTLGTFLSPCERQKNTQYHQSINCTNSPDVNNTVTHLNHRFKATDEITWLAPITLKGSVRFSYTVVYDETLYWVNQKTAEFPVEVLSEEDYNVKNYIYKNKLQWYFEQFYRKNCYGHI